MCGRVAVRCLVVSETMIYARAIGIQLARDGLDVVGLATSIIGALQLNAQHHPDVVVVGLRLGQESGIECASQLTRSTDGDRPVVILTSAYEERPSTDRFAFLPTNQIHGDSVRAAVTRAARLARSRSQRTQP